jgi:hypothetical protein
MMVKEVTISKPAAAKMPEQAVVRAPELGMSKEREP